MTFAISYRIRLAYAATVLGLFAPAGAWAAITCTVTVTPMSVVYDPTIATDSITSGSYTIGCTRLVSDPTALNWSLGASNGLTPSGATNQAVLGVDAYKYELYRIAPYTNANRWQDTLTGANTTRITGTLNFGTLTSASVSGVFDLRLAAAQALKPAGTYLDTVTATLRETAGGTTLTTSTFSVSVITTPTCQIVGATLPITLAYTAFQIADAVATTNFSVRCTSALAYTMALDPVTPVTKVLHGLNYTLAVPASGTGTGLTQVHVITGTIAANQAGTCGVASCNATNTHTVQVTY